MRKSGRKAVAIGAHLGQITMPSLRLPGRLHNGQHGGPGDAVELRQRAYARLGLVSRDHRLALLWRVSAGLARPFRLRLSESGPQSPQAIHRIAGAAGVSCYR